MNPAALCSRCAVSLVAMMWVSAGGPAATAAGFIDKGAAMNVRSRWQRSGDDGYHVASAGHSRVSRGGHPSDWDS